MVSGGEAITDERRIQHHRSIRHKGTGNRLFAPLIAWQKLSPLGLNQRVFFFIERSLEWTGIGHVIRDALGAEVSTLPISIDSNYTPVICPLQLAALLYAVYQPEI